MPPTEEAEYQEGARTRKALTVFILIGAAAVALAAARPRFSLGWMPDRARSDAHDQWAGGAGGVGERRRAADRDKTRAVRDRGQEVADRQQSRRRAARSPGVTPDVDRRTASPFRWTRSAGNVVAPNARAWVKSARAAAAASGPSRNARTPDASR